MKKREKKLLALLASALLFALAVSFGGGCGGSDSDSRDIHVIGQLHGDYADELTALYDVMAPGGEINAPIIVSHEEGLNLTDEDANLLKKYLMAGQAVGIEHVDQTEVNLFLDKLGFKTDDSIVPDDTHYEYYGIKVIGNDIFSYVVADDEENAPVGSSIVADTIVSGEVYVSQDVTVTLPDGVNSRKEGDSLSVTSGDETVIFSKAEVVSHGENNNYSIADSMVDWMYDNKNQEEYARKGKKAVSNEINSERLRGAGSVNLKEVSSLCQRTFDASQSGNNFRITVDIYSCHSYNTADNTESDWFIIKQKGQLNPSANYYNKNHRKTVAASQGGYIVSYEFENTPVNGQYNGTKVTGVKLDQSSPSTTVGSSGISSGVSVNIGGNVGFSGLTLAGGVSGGVSYSNTESQTVPDVCVTNNSAVSGGANVTKWKYSFSRPLLRNGPYFAACNDLYDAPLASRSLFQPVNQWVWIVPSECRDEMKGFNMAFTYTSGYSYSAAYAWWVKVAKEEHHSYNPVKKNFYVPFTVYPPLISANSMDFEKTGGSKKLELMCMRDWIASSDSDWCKITRTRGGKDDVNDIRVQMGENTTQKNREAWITLETADGKGKTKVKIFQSAY